MKTSELQHRVLALSLVAVVTGVAFATSLASGRAGAQRKYPSYPRAETLITTGTEWGGIRGFNPYFDAYAVGTVGLCNETLLRYDPLKDKYINWLAESAGFTGRKAYAVKVRRGIRWSNGQKFTGRDVAFNFKLGRFSTAFWHDLYTNLKSIKVKGRTVTFKFKKTPNYIQWQNLIWNLPMVNPGQARSITSAASLEAFGQEAPIGTGPYELDVAGYDPTTRVVWKKRVAWWATQQKLAPSPKPTYIMGFVCGRCDIETWHFDDLRNLYMPGVQNLVASKKALTYYPGKPYNLSANTAWLTPNTTHKPLDDRAFRRALATSINVGNIVANDYGHLVRPANATGLLPTWKKWIDQKQLKALGFTYSTEKAKSLLAAAGYRDTNGDGYVENKDGSTIDLKISVPMGWSDWESARDMIVASAKNAGIHLYKDEGDFIHWQSERDFGAFDLVLDNTPQLSDNPWTYFDYLFRRPILATQTSANFSRYSNVNAWNLAKKLDQTPLAATSKRMATVKKLEKIVLTELPSIPLWHGGLWSLSQSMYWTNWPSSTSTRNYTASMARGYMQMTGIDMITHLEPTPDK